MDDPNLSVLFQHTWEGAESYYLSWANRPGLAFLGPMATLVAELRQQGFDRTCRLGHALYFLVLSRSWEHGLRPDQSFVQLRPFPDRIEIHSQLAGRAGFAIMQSATLEPQLEWLLRQLATESVD